VREPPEMVANMMYVDRQGQNVETVADLELREHFGLEHALRRRFTPALPGPAGGPAGALARAYYADLERLQERFGGYALFWLYCADRLLAGSLGQKDRVAYPLWESPVW
jgi:hypothetical protein